MKNRAGRLSMGQGGNKLVAGLIAALIALTDWSPLTTCSIVN